VGVNICAKAGTASKAVAPPRSLGENGERILSASPLSVFLFLLIMSFGFAVLALDPDYQLDSDF